MKQIILDLTKNSTIEITQDSELLGIFIGKNSQQVNSCLKIIHKIPHLKSQTLIKGVLFNSSEFNISGDIIIKKGAYLTDAYLKMDILLMSESAKATAIPSLEITENNVKGGHGATVGQLDREQLFYLESRGLKDHEAKKLLIEGFIADLTARIKDAKIRQMLLKQLK
ncbi:MAG TPA: SufD family Fe-S cluster assembly protein [Candidatus Dojkabacteria bacterium]|nr:SufD family Fe-S cluster assembly protein [Candidatus Dojkabacteria bacterium]